MSHIERSRLECAQCDGGNQKIESLASYGKSPKQLPLHSIVLDEAVLDQPIPNHILD
jgi:hypothetical protein